MLTCAGGRVRLPEEAAVDLGAGYFAGPLQDVAGVALEYHVVPGLPAVPAARPVGGHARVVAGGRRGDWEGRKQTFLSFVLKNKSDLFV